MEVDEDKGLGARKRATWLAPSQLLAGLDPPPRRKTQFATHIREKMLEDQMRQGRLGKAWLVFHQNRDQMFGSDAIFEMGQDEGSPEVGTWTGGSRGEKSRDEIFPSITKVSLRCLNRKSYIVVSNHLHVVFLLIIDLI